MFVLGGLLVSPKHGSNQGIEVVSYKCRCQVKLIIQAFETGRLKPGAGGLKMFVDSSCASTKIGEKASRRTSKSGTTYWTPKPL